MIAGKIVLVPFPFADKVERKVRPALVIGKTKDRFEDRIVCAISSVILNELSENDILISPTTINGLRVISCIKIDRIATIPSTQIIYELSELDNS